MYHSDLDHDAAAGLAGEDLFAGGEDLGERADLDHGVELFERQVDAMRASGILAVVHGEDEYPACLVDDPDPPVVLSANASASGTVLHTKAGNPGGSPVLGWRWM